MKIKNVLFIAFLAAAAAPSVSFGQQTQKGAPVVVTAAVAPAVREGDKLMSQGSKNALTLDMPKTTAKLAEKLWKDYAKQFKGDTKKDKKSEEWFTDNAMIASIGGANTIDMYAKFAESGDVTTMSLWVDLGGAYVGSKDFKDKYAEAEKIMSDFSLLVQKEQTKTLLEEQNDGLKKLEKQQKGLEKDKKSLEDDIVAWKKKIEKAEADIVTNGKNQDEQKVKIENQKKLVEEIQKKLATFK